ncbi:fimbria/pilus periplasmic chaperone [Serratia liquefaciens]|uniref:fimbria/pilus periplasmic chaperone n=1 Tax=Serratia liquefaciens TaxID=614 RepID=UPI00381E0882
MSVIASVALFHIHAATAADVHAHVTKYETVLGANRVIYNTASNGAVLSVTNPQDFPMLIQSTVLGENFSPVDTYVVTPPVFRLDAKRTSKLSIVLAEEGDVIDRESLNWLCVKSIPPKNDDVWAKDGDDASVKKQADVNLQLSMNNCIKLIRRPEKLKGSPESGAESLSWQMSGKELKATNSSPFYMNLASLMLDNKPVNHNKYIAPYSSQSFSLSPGVNKGHTVSWQIINDFGGNSKTYTKGLH